MEVALWHQTHSTLQQNSPQLSSEPKLKKMTSSDEEGGKKLAEAMARRAQRIFADIGHLSRPNHADAVALKEEPPPLLERVTAVLVCGAVADAIGFHGGAWEFCRSGRHIHADLRRLTKGRGVCALTIAGPDWRVSDDTVLHIATAEALAEDGGNAVEEVCRRVAARFCAWWPELIRGRSPGVASVEGIRRLRPDGSGWDAAPFDANAGGCGAAMRAMVIGVRFADPSQLRELVACAVESGRITHHCGTGYLGAVCAAFFTALALQRVHPREWGARLLSEAVPLAKSHIAQAGRAVQQNLASMEYFVQRWTEYLRIRHLLTPEGTFDPQGPLFPAAWNNAEEDDDSVLQQRDEWYTFLSFSGLGGASGHDIVIIAYDALLWAGPSWEKLLLAGALHGGDSDSTGHVAGALWGALYGMSTVPPCHYTLIEFGEKLVRAAEQLCAKVR